MVAALVVLSALLHALWNGLLKTQPDRSAAGAAVVGVCAVVAIAAAIVYGPLSPGAAFPVASGLAWSAGAGLFEGIYFVLLVVALDRAPLAAAYTISRGVAILVVWPISIALLHEPIAAAAVAGSAILCLGLAVSGGEARGGGSAGGVAAAVSCGVAIAGYHLCYKQALGSGAEPTAVFAVALGLAFPINLARLGRARIPALGRALRARPGLLGALGLMTAASFLVFLVALGRGGAGFVLTLRNTSIVFTALIGWMLGERPSRWQLTGAVLVAAGAVLVGLSR